LRLSLRTGVTGAARRVGEKSGMRGQTAKEEKTWTIIKEGTKNMGRTLFGNDGITRKEGGKEI